MTLRKPVVDEQWLSLNRTIHQVAPLCRNPEHLENAAGVSADAPRKAGVELTRQQMMKIRFSISISPEMRSMCYEGKIPYPDGTIFEKGSTGYFHTKGCRRT